MRRSVRSAAVGLVLLGGLFRFGGAGRPPDGPPVEVSVEAEPTRTALLQEEDTDGDAKITIDDPHVPGTGRGDKRFWLTATDGQRYEIAGVYYLSNLLQELSLAVEAGSAVARLRRDRIFEAPADRISRMIREFYWDGLTRRVDERGLVSILRDEKTQTVDGFHYVYVPHDDPAAFRYFSAVAARHPEWKLRVVRLPREVSPAYVRRLDGYHGILSLALVPAGGNSIYAGVPFVVPGGRFNEMYGWDSYFIVLGLLEDGRVDLARAIVDNFVYEITHYGKVLNANRTYYLTRSQPPFLTSMARAVYERLPKDEASRQWLADVIRAAIREYETVWLHPTRRTPIGLSRYFDPGLGPPPEVEPGHFDVVYARYAPRFGMDVRSFEEAYRTGKVRVPELDEYFTHDRCMRESGHDTSYRLEGRCARLATVDLNSLLYKFERDIAEVLEQVFGGSLRGPDGRVETSAAWSRRAEWRKALIERYLWNETRGLFFDYDFVEGRQTGYVSATTFYPLWAGLARPEQAARLVTHALPLLETPGGVAGSSEAARGPITPERPLRQWDYPHGWAPHQVLTWMGLRRYGYDAVAHRLIYKWLYTVVVNAVHYNGTVTEKYDVVQRSHRVFAEYGNVGTEFAYITREGFGWTNASFQVGLRWLPADLRDRLNRLIPPEWVFSPGPSAVPDAPPSSRRPVVPKPETSGFDPASGIQDIGVGGGPPPTT